MISYITILCIMPVLTKKEMTKSKNCDFSMKQEKVIFSNYLEELYEVLKKHLFSHLSLSSLIYVFVPSDKVKQWLLQRLAREEGIVGGISFCTLADLFPLFKKQLFPDIFDLELILQEEIFLKRSQNQKDEKEATLWNFLEEKGSLSQKKIVQLSQILSTLFFQYGIYGREHLSSWEKPKGWQEALWHEIFDRKKWKTPAKDLFFLENKSFEKDLTIHLFALNHLPSLHREMIHQLSLQHPVFFYLLSPTFCFWEDQTSDKERRTLFQLWKKKKLSQKQMEEMDLYIQGRNPLLANLGKVNRELLKILDREEMQIEERYLPVQRDSLLHSIQEDLLSLTNPQLEEKEKIFAEDRSVQIHQAASLMREVEILYDFLLQKIHKEQLSFSDVMVVAPEIALYEPFIHQVFGDGPIPYQIFDLSLCEKSFFARGIRDFFRLVHSKWTKEDLARLFENPALLSKHAIDWEEISSLLPRAGFTWGLDKEHRKRFIDSQGDVSGQGSWQDVFDRLIEGFALSPEENDPISFPVFFEKSKAALLDRFLFLFGQLKKDIAFLESSCSLSVEEMADFFEKIATFYFAIEERNSCEQKAFSLFQQALIHMRQKAKKFGKKKFFIETLFAHLWKKMQASYATSTNLLEKVEFSSFQEGAFVPSKVICLLGLQEDFPRNEPRSSLHLLYKEKTKEFVSLLSERDRSLFLEAVLSARETLYMSTPSQSTQEGRSLLIEEFLSYVESRFSFEKGLEHQMITLHPQFSFDRSYFVNKKDFTSFSSLSFRAAACLYQEKKERENIWQQELPQATEEIIDVKSLELVAKHPIKFFFQKGLKIFLEEEQNESFFLSPLQKYSLRNSLLKNERETIVQSLQKKSSFCSGTILEILKEEAEKELLSYEDKLIALGVDTKKIFFVDMVEGCEEAVFQRDHWISPPIEIVRNESRVKIVGRLEGLSPLGLLHHGEGLFWDWMRIFPKLLIYCHLPFFEKGDLLFSKAGKKKKFSITDPLFHLSRYLDYYEKAKKAPSPLIREWAQLFFGTEQAWDDVISKTNFMSRSEDPYLHRLFFLSEKPKAASLHKQWKDVVCQAFAPILPLCLEKRSEVKDVL